MWSEIEFATAGVRHFKVWSITTGNVLTNKRGTFGAGNERFDDKITSLKAFGSKYLAGTIAGDLIVWVGVSIAKKSKKGMF